MDELGQAIPSTVEAMKVRLQPIVTALENHAGEEEVNNAITTFIEDGLDVEEAKALFCISEVFTDEGNLDVAADNVIDAIEERFNEKHRVETLVAQITDLQQAV